MLAAYVGYKLQGITGAVVGAFAIFAPAFILVLSVMPIMHRIRELAWIKAAMRAISAAVIGVISVSLVQMTPHAAPDAFAAALVLLTVVCLLYWKWGPLPVMLGGALAGAAYRTGPFQRLKELL
jgi:chromate transporter